MAKRSKKKVEGDIATMGTRRLEAMGIVLLMGAFALLFALVTFDPGDRSQNLVGPVGHSIARTLIGGIGVVG